MYVLHMFIEMVTTMTMSYSYKPVFILSFLDHMDTDGRAKLEDVVQSFADYYENRTAKGLVAEKKSCIFTKGGYSDKDVERLILSMPFKRFEDTTAWISAFSLFSAFSAKVPFHLFILQARICCYLSICLAFSF